MSDLANTAFVLICHNTIKGFSIYFENAKDVFGITTWAWPSPAWKN